MIYALCMCVCMLTMLLELTARARHTRLSIGLTGRRTAEAGSTLMDRDTKNVLLKWSSEQNMLSLLNLSFDLHPYMVLGGKRAIKCNGAEM